MDVELSVLGSHLDCDNVAVDAIALSVPILRNADLMYTALPSVVLDESAEIPGI